MDADLDYFSEYVDAFSAWVDATRSRCRVLTTMCVTGLPEWTAMAGTLDRWTSFVDGDYLEWANAAPDVEGRRLARAAVDARRSMTTQVLSALRVRDQATFESLDGPADQRGDELADYLAR